MQLRIADRLIAAVLAASVAGIASAHEVAATRADFVPPPVGSYRLERILENMLPKAVADRLRTEGRAFADPCPDCSVLFADLVGFTELSERLPADEVDEVPQREVDVDGVQAPRGQRRRLQDGRAAQGADLEHAGAARR